MAGRSPRCPRQLSQLYSDRVTRAAAKPLAGKALRHSPELTRRPGWTGDNNALPTYGKWIISGERRGIWQNSMAGNWPQLLQPRACRPALCFFTADSNLRAREQLQHLRKDAAFFAHSLSLALAGALRPTHLD